MHFRSARQQILPRYKERASHLCHLSKIWVSSTKCWNNQLEQRIDTLLAPFFTLPVNNFQVSDRLFICWAREYSPFLLSFSQTSVTYGGGEERGEIFWTHLMYFKKLSCSTEITYTKYFANCSVSSRYRLFPWQNYPKCNEEEMDIKCAW